MPLSTVNTEHQSGATGRVFVMTCDEPGCGAEAAYGIGSLREAIKTKDPTKVKLACPLHRNRLEPTPERSLPLADLAPSDLPNAPSDDGNETKNSNSPMLDI